MEIKWTTLANRLRSDIDAERLSGVLPSEAELMAQFSVSRTTVRKALAQLVSEGLIDSSQGTRRQVRKRERINWPMHDWESKHEADADAWAVSIREQGGESATAVSVAVENATQQVADALDVEVGSSVVVRHRVRSVDGETHQLADSYFPYDLVKDHPAFLTPGDQSAPRGLLAAAGIPQVRYRDTIESRMPTPDEARQLSIPPGTPLLLHHRTGYAKDGRAIRHMVTRMDANRVEISYELKS